MNKLLILITLFLIVSCHAKAKPHVLGEYELSTEESIARKQCDGFFKKFHGKYFWHKHYGVEKKASSLQFFKQPNCAMACITNTIAWECSFNTNDDEMGYMSFRSDWFQE